MSNEQTHIDQIIQEKLSQFQEMPPEHIWAGIEEGIADTRPPVFFTAFAKQFIAAAAIIVLIALSIWYFIPVNESQPQLGENDGIEQNESENIVISNEEQESQEINSDENLKEDNLPIEDETKGATITEDHQNTVLTVTVNDKPANQNTEQTRLSTDEQLELTYLLNKDESSIEISENRNAGTEHAIENSVVFANRKTNPVQDLSNEETVIPNFKNYWNIGLYFTPEMMFNTIDSVTLLNTYSLNIEPSWYFSKHWFMRFGAGVSYVRDRGFAKVDFISKDYMGSYDSVVNVTFEEVDDEMVALYHTQEVDIWDSIRHLSISEITNTYYYLQFPLMFGYHNSSRHFKWYFYGGPALNISISEQIADPKADIDYIEIIDLENRLPNRLDYALQLWVGAGIDFQIGQRFSLAVEPNYRYYFKPIYQENDYETALSGLGIRFGLVYKLEKK